jgi:hypothetical protein
MPNGQDTKTTTAKKVFLKNGELFAVPFPKKSRAISAPPTRVESVTSYKAAFVDTSHAIQPAQGSGARRKKPLVPYQAEAMRSRLPVKFENEAVPYKRYCAPSNLTQFTIKDGSASESTRFVTTNKRAYTGTDGMPTGFSNQAIVAEHTKWLHKRIFS